MNAIDHAENPLTGYRSSDGVYPTYLDELGAIFAETAQHLVLGGHLVINAANIRTGDTVTPLAWDIARTVAPPLTYRGEIYLDWDVVPSSFSGDYLLVFRRD